MDTSAKALLIQRNKKKNSVHKVFVYTNGFYKKQMKAKFSIAKKAEEVKEIILYIISIPEAIIICSYHKSTFSNSYIPFETKW